MNKLILVIISLLCLAIDVFANKHSTHDTTINCGDSNYLSHNPNFILYCAQKTLPNSPQTFKYQGKLESRDYTKYSYLLSSVKWPWKVDATESINPRQWNNIVEIYVPHKIPKSPAFVYIDGGNNYGKQGNPLLIGQMDPIFSGIVQQMWSTNILIDIKYIPTQYLNINGVSKKEDAIVAYSWKKFINSPSSFIYHPLHIPMQVSVSQSITLAQNVLKNQLGIVVDKFIVAGTSKRGWTAWLTGLADSRVVGIVPIVSDMLNTTKQFSHVFNTYGKHWPIALKDYYIESIAQYMDESNQLYSNYLKLMEVEDPYSYLKNGSYKEKLKNIPIYAINSSGDDFFVPDASKYYFGDLHGNNALLYIPNSSHYVGQSGFLNKLVISIGAYSKRVTNKSGLPVIDWDSAESNNIRKITAKFNEKPNKVTLWVAKNTITRDFRYACGIEYTPTDIQINNTVVSASYSLSEAGWGAGFLELDFKDGLVIGSPIYIDPDTYPSSKQIMPQKGMCLIIQ